MSVHVTSVLGRGTRLPRYSLWLSPSPGFLHLKAAHNTVEGESSNHSNSQGVWPPPAGQPQAVATGLMHTLLAATGDVTSSKPAMLATCLTSYQTWLVCPHLLALHLPDSDVLCLSNLPNLLRSGMCDPLLPRSLPYPNNNPLFPPSTCVG